MSASWMRRWAALAAHFFNRLTELDYVLPPFLRAGL